MNKTLIALASFLLLPLCLIAVMVAALMITSKWESADKVDVVCVVEDVAAGAPIPEESLEQRKVDSHKAPQSCITSLVLVRGRTCTGSLHKNDILTVDDLGPVKNAVHDKTKSLAGRYSGMSSGQPIVTTFKEDGKQKWIGRYISQSEMHTYHGTLDELVTSKNEMSGKWHDKFGAGTVHLQFQKDGSFLGTWENLHNSDHGDWSGVKTSDPPGDSDDEEDEAANAI